MLQMPLDPDLSTDTRSVLGILFTFGVMGFLMYEQKGSFFLPGGTGIKDRERPLTAASGQGHVEVVRLLLEAGADKNLADNDGSTALMCAALWEKVEVMRLLLEAGADMNMADIDGNTALMHAAGEGNHGALRLLVEAGADKNLKNKNGETASFLAARASC